MKLPVPFPKLKKDQPFFEWFADFLRSPEALFYDDFAMLFYHAYWRWISYYPGITNTLDYDQFFEKLTLLDSQKGPNQVVDVSTNGEMRLVTAIKLPD